VPHGSYIVASALRDPIDALRERGGDVLALCRRIGTDPVPSPEASLSLRSFVGFSQAAAEDLRAPGFGWSVGARFDLANIGRVGEAVQRAPTLGAALRLFRDAFAMVQGDSMIDLEVDGDVATVSYRILNPRIWPRDQDAELTVAVLAGLVDRAAGCDWRPIDLAFEHGPNGADGMRLDGPRCRVRYRAQTNSLRFPARMLDLPMPGGNADSFRPLERALAHEASRLEHAQPVAVRVRRHIIGRLGRDAVGQSAIAVVLGMSRRTLRRRLDEEGTTYSDLLAECRIGIARRMLAEPEIAIADVATRLGYSDTTAFERAYRRHEGMTPAQFRRQFLRP